MSASQSKLLKSRALFIKYKSYLILALLVAVVSFILGYTVAYNRDLNWVYHNTDNTEKFVQLSAQTYELQRNIALNYSEAHEQLTECLKFDQKTCDAETAGKKLDTLAQERDKMIIELNKLNFQIGTLLKEMGFLK